MAQKTQQIIYSFLAGSFLAMGFVIILMLIIMNVFIVEFSQIGMIIGSIIFGIIGLILLYITIKGD